MIQQQRVNLLIMLYLCQSAFCWSFIYERSVYMKVSFSKRLTTVAVTSAFTVTSLMTVLPVFFAASADDEKELLSNDKFSYYINDEGTVTIMGYAEGYTPDAAKIVLPSKIDGKYVTEIGSRAFSANSSNSVVTEIVLPDHIEKVCSWGFGFYKALDTIVVPATLKEADRLFTYCRINKVIIEDGMETVPDGFLNCTDYLGELVIPDSVTKIGKDSFSSIGGLTEVSVPDSVKSIGYAAFKNCGDLRTLELPDELGFIGSYAFSDLPALESFTVPEGWSFDPEGSGFFQNSGLKEITFAGSREIIPGGICHSCQQLETVNWPSELKTIMSRAFEQTAIKDPKLPEGLETIEEYAFRSSAVNNVELPKSLTYLGNRSFGENPDLKYVYIPSQYPAVGRFSECSAFNNSGITKVEYADGITEVNALTSKLPELKEIVIPDSVTFINAYSFDGDTALEHIDLPDSVTRIHYQSVFAGCESLRELTIPPLLESDKGCLGSPPAIEEVRFADGMEKIPDEICSYCETLKKVYIPESVKTIGAGAFSRCFELGEIEMTQDSVEIQHDAFDWCDNLWDERFSIAKKGDLFINKTSASSATGSLSNYTVYYSLNPRFAEEFSEAYLTISTDASNVIPKECLPEGIEQSSYGFTMNFTEPSGIIRFSVREPEDKDVKVTAEFGVKITPKEASYAWMERHIVVPGVEARAVTLTAPVQVGSSDGSYKFTVYGSAPVNEEVTVYLGDEAVATATSNQYTGRYCADITAAADLGDELVLYAQCGDIKSDKVSVGCNNSAIEVEKVVLMHNNNHKGYEADITDAFKYGKQPYLAINPNKQLGFEVTLSDNECERVCISSTTNGRTSMIDLEYSEESGTWKGWGNFDTPIPGTMNVVAIPRLKDTTVVVGSDENGNATVSTEGGKLLFNTAVTSKEEAEVKAFLEEYPMDIAANEKDVLAVSFTPKKLDASKAAGGYPPSLAPLSRYSEAVSCNAYFSDAPSMKIVCATLDKFVIDGKTYTPEEAIAADTFKFDRLPVLIKQADGSYVEQYIMPIDESQLGIADKIAKNISVGAETADKYLRDIGNNAIEGVIVITRDVENAIYNTYVQMRNNVLYYLGDNIVSALSTGLKDLAGKIAGPFLFGVNAISSFISLYFKASELDAAYQYLDTLENSKDPEVRSKVLYLKTMIMMSSMMRTLCVIGALVVGGMLMIGSLINALTAPIAFVLGLIFGTAFYILNCLFDAWDEELIRESFAVSNNGKINSFIDPSGYVYAAVPDNRVEGATATIYYKDSGGKAVKWNAEDYDQINDQITDSAGWFAWDVPEGEWQVKITAKGYEDYTTEWLPVLPVQTDVNIPLRTKTAAKLESVDAFSNGVEIKMSQYIDDSTATADNIYLTDSKGKAVNCKIKPVKSETNDSGYSDTILLISDKENISGSTLHITKGLLNYSGIATTAVEQKITEVKSELLVDDDYSLGDVNEDGKVDAKDASMVLVAYAKSSTGAEHGLTEAQAGAANVNGDALIDAKDASFILAYYAMASTAEGTVPSMIEFMASKAA